MTTKEQLWEELCKEIDPDLDPENEPEQSLKAIFFSDRVTIDTEEKAEDLLGGISLSSLLEELKARPLMEAYLGRWQVELDSPSVHDINAQDHYPSWVTAAVESCDRVAHQDGTHGASWALG